jgi:hypothetical protein
MNKLHLSAAVAVAVLFCAIAPASAQSDDLMELGATVVSNAELDETRGEGLGAALPTPVPPILFYARDAVKPFIPGGSVLGNALKASHDMTKNAIRNMRG